MLVHRSPVVPSLIGLGGLADHVLEASPDIIIVLDPDGNLVFANRTAWGATRMAPPTGPAKIHWTTFIPTSIQAPIGTALAKARRRKSNRFFLKESFDDGSYLWWDVAATLIGSTSSKDDNLVLIARDFTESHVETERIRWNARHDSMTSLPNRGTFNDELERLTDRRNGQYAATLVLVDVDHFKLINDSLGHDAGDALLKTFATRLRNAVRETDVVARLGGDEFAIILKDLVTAPDIHRVVEGILLRLHQPFTHEGRSVHCRASMGAAIYPEHGTAGPDLLKSADLALYHAKAHGRGRLAIFNDKMREELNERSAMVARAREALREERIVPYYQPKIRLRTGQVDGFEALLRWNDDSGGTNGPMSIAAGFEDPEVAIEIGRCIQSQVFADVRRWIEAGVDFGHVAINVADAEFREDCFAETLLDHLRDFGIPTGRIRLEVTETVFMGKGSSYVERALALLKAEGVHIALDDFGTGYASLMHLRQFPVDEIKVDQSFTRDLEDPDTAAIIRALLMLGRSLDIEVVAEGIETTAQVEFLEREGCLLGQGFLFAQAVPASKVPCSMLEASRWKWLAGRGSAEPPEPPLRAVGNARWP